MKHATMLLAAILLLGCGSDPTPSEGSKAHPAADDKTAIAPELAELFEEVNIVKMHLFGTKEAEPTQEKYPYAGKPIGEAELKYLNSDLQPNEIGSVYACHRTEGNGLFVLRVPGKYASSDLALAKWDAAAGKLVKVMTLASLQCDEGVCIQQDAWITDLDDDRSFEIVTRSHTNDNGKISGETFTVLHQQPPGNFTPAPEQLASLAPQTSYVMFK